MKSPGDLSIRRRGRKETGPSPGVGGPGPPVQGDEGGDGGEWVLLTTAANSVIAHLIEGRLSEEGIPCVLDDFDPSPGAWLKPFGDPLAPVRVFVARRYLASASLVLHEIGHQPPNPSHEGPHLVRVLWLVTISVITVITLLTLFEMFLSGRM